MTLLLGVDAGGSKTRALVCRPGGEVVATGESSSGNPLSVGWDRAGAAIRDAVAKTGATGFAAACFGVAGVDREADRERLEQWVHNARFAALARVVHDSELVLAAGTPDGWGIGLICGTGSVAVGRSRAGRTARAGGWGIVDDEGSGWAMGIALLRAAVRSVDRRTPAPAVVDAVTRELGMTIDDVIAHVHRPESTRAEVARLAPIALRLAADGDDVARAIVDDAAQAAAALVVSVRDAIDEPDAPLAFAGGLALGSAEYRAAIAARAGVKDTRVVDDPARGAILIAQRLLG